MQFLCKRGNKPYINVIFGNFYSPAYDNEAFIDETMALIKRLRFTSVMFDTKASQDFKERYETGALSQYVKMQEYMGKSALAHGLSYNFLLLYLNGDNLYPHIRFSPPVLGEGTVRYDGTPANWYKYWSDKAKESMAVHVSQIMERYGAGCGRFFELGDGSGAHAGHDAVPVCSMWDPVVAPSFDEEGRQRYTSFLEEFYGGSLDRLNQNYGMEAASFSGLSPEEYWYPLKYGEGTFFTEEDARECSPRFMVWRDNAVWKMRELVLYFKDMQEILHHRVPGLFLCPDMSQWGYFLNIYGRGQADLDNGFSDLWDTAMRGIDVYALAPYVDSCHFITVPVTPDGCPDAYVVSCQHSMMRVMNEGKPVIGGIYWGRFIYNDLYASLTPAEMIGTMACCGIDGYTSYGMNGLDDGGVLNRMGQDFLDSLALGNEWLARVLARRKGRRRQQAALLFPSEMAHFEPFEVGNNKIRRLDLLGWYRICCDLGYQADIISSHEVERGALSNYQILIVPANSCYHAMGHEESEARIREWVRQGGVMLHGPQNMLAKSCFGIGWEECGKIPYHYKKTVIPQGEAFCRYKGGISISDYIGQEGCCIAYYTGKTLAQLSGEPDGDFKGAVYSFGVQMGASYGAKNIPHVPYGQGNKEMYPFLLANTGLFEDIFGRYAAPAGGIAGRGIEIGVFENGAVIVNHRPTPYVLPREYRVADSQYPAGCTDDGRAVLAAHSAAWAEIEIEKLA